MMSDQGSLSPHNENFTALPDDPLSEVLVLLSPEDLVNLRSAHSAFKKIILDKKLWKKKLELHFPHRMMGIVEASQDESYFYTQFQKAYEAEYKNVPKDKRRFFSLVKEGDAASLSKTAFRLCDLAIKDSCGVSLLEWADRNRKENQALFDLFYQKVVGIQQLVSPANCKNELSEISSLKLTTLFEWAIFCNQPLEVILNLIPKTDEDEDFHIRNKAFMVAIQQGNVDFVEIWLKKLKEYDTSGCLTKAGFTTEKRISFNAAVLVLAIKCGRKKVVDLLLNVILKVSVIVDIYRFPYFKLFNISDGEAPLHAAIKAGRLDIVNALVDKGADVHALVKGYNALHAAIKAGRLDIVKALVEQGANVHTLIKGVNALHLAVHENQIEMVRFLIQHVNSADYVDEPDADGATALLLAITRNFDDMTSFLLKQKADVSIGLSRDTYPYHMGDTPLHIVAKLGNINNVDLLLCYGADVATKNNRKKTPSEVAPSDSFAYQVELLAYAHKARDRENNHYKKYVTLFGRTVNFGFPAAVKKAASKALVDVLFNKADSSILNAHQAALNNGDLGVIYRGLCKTGVIPKPASSSSTTAKRLLGILRYRQY